MGRGHCEMTFGDAYDAMRLFLARLALGDWLSRPATEFF